MIDPDAVTTVTVDSYTTLADVDAQEAALSAAVDGLADAEAVSRAWRSRTMLYSVVANDIDAYRPFSELLDLALEYALASHGHDVPATVREDVRRTVYERRLSIFEDVRPGLERLRDAGYDIYVLSNGDPGMLAHLVAAADIEDVVVDAISADEVRTYKPDPAIYRHAATRTGTPIDRILHASGGSMRDVWGAGHAGMRTAWLRRPEKSPPRESLGRDPDVTVTDFEDLADRLGA